MSRSVRAWRENCRPVIAAASGVVKQTKTDSDRVAPLGVRRLDATISATNCLVRSLIASLLAIVLVPSSALASRGGSHPGSQPSQISAQRDHIGGWLLALGSGYASRQVAAQVRVVQRDLARLRFAPGPVDGRYGPLTEEAVERFQSARELQVDGVAGPITLAALRGKTTVLYPGAGDAGHGSDAVRTLQRRLARAGFVPGPVDGRYGPLTEKAVRRFQSAHGLRIDGIAGPQTFIHLSTSTRPTRAVRGSRPARRPQPANRGGEHRAPQSPVARHTPAGRHHVLAGGPESRPSPGLIAALMALILALGLLAMWLWRRYRKQPDGRRAGTNVSGLDQSKRAEARPEAELAVSDAPAAIPSTTERTPTEIHIPSSLEQPALSSEESERVFRYATLLEGYRDLSGAAVAYQRADQLGHQAAAAQLGLLLQACGNDAAAEAWYLRADQLGDPDGAFNLALMLEERGDLAGAMAAYRRADSLGHSTAATYLGVHIENEGDQASAEDCYRRADERGDPNGAFNLGAALEKRGNHLGAIRAYERAEQLGGPDIAGHAHAAAQRLKKRVDASAGVAQGGGRHDS